MSCRFLQRPEIEKRQQRKHHHGEQDRGTNAKTVKLGADDQFAMNDILNMIGRPKVMRMRGPELRPPASVGHCRGRKPKCESQRPSAAKKARRSFMPYLSIAMRSI